MEEDLKKKIDLLSDLIKPLESVIVALSGGVDSSVLLKVAADTLGRENVLAATAVGWIYPSFEREIAEKIASQIGVGIIFIENPALDQMRFLANGRDRCYWCKRAISERLLAIAGERGYKAVLVGENADDASSYRPGRRALEELSIRMPLLEARLGKSEIRELARLWGLLSWNLPSNPCLATRFEYDFPLDRSLAGKIDRMESYMRSLGFEYVRVRLHRNGLVRIELSPDKIRRVFKEDLAESIVERARALGLGKFITIDLEGYRSGSMD